MNIEHRSDLYNERAEELCMIGESSSFESNGSYTRIRIASRFY